MSQKINLLKTILMGIFCLLMGSAFAKDLGVIGEIYPITELDMRQIIQQHLLLLQQQGELDKLTSKLNRDLQQQMDRPIPVNGLQRTTEPRTWFFDPSIRIPYDLRNTNGDIIIPAGTTINPLDTLSSPESLLFYNADDPTEVQWVKQKNKQLKNNAKLILVNGSVISQMNLFKRPVFFDQGGRLITRFKIKQVPAIITQQGNRLKIQEVSP